MGLEGVKDSKLVLTPRQRLALEEETRLRQTGALPAQPVRDNSQELLTAFLGRQPGGGNHRNIVTSLQVGIETVSEVAVEDLEPRTHRSETSSPFSLSILGNSSVLWIVIGD